jgi:hypothetical protein
VVHGPAVFRTIVMIRLAIGGAALVAALAGRLALGGGWEAPYSEPLRLSPQPSPTAPPAALTAFAALVSDGGARAQARIDGSIHFAVPLVDVAATIKLSGAKATVKYDGGSTRWLEFSSTGATVRTRARNGGIWQPLPTGMRSGNPFGKPMAVEIQYHGMATVSGKKLHHVVIVNPRSIAAAIDGRDLFTQLEPSFSSYDVYVNDKGVPVSAGVRYKGRAAYDAITVALDIDYRYTFTKVS